MKLIDLSLTLGPRITPVTGHPRVKFEDIDRHETDGRSNTLLTMSVHTGTHIDAPYHFHPDGKTIDQMPLEKFVGEAVLVDLRGRVRPKEPVTIEDLQAAGIGAAEDLRGLRVVLFSGWAAEHWYKEDFYTANPYLSEEAAHWFAEAGIEALGLDFGVDKGQPYPCHRILLAKEICLIENLVNLDKIRTNRFTLVALPVKLERGNGGMARVVAIV